MPSREADIVDFDNNSAVDGDGNPVFGRREELVAIASVVASAADGLGAALVLVGEPGAGKSTLLRHAVSTVDGACVRAVAGIEAESPYAYAALHRLLLADLDLIERLPSRQRAALAVALGLAEGAHANDQLVGLALLSLLADICAASPTVLCVDDAQWVDAESLRALAFAARRIQAEGVALVFAVRSGEPALDLLTGLATIDLAGLGIEDAIDLLRTSVGTPLSERVAERIVDATGGNPLALIDLGRELSSAELSGAETVHEPIAVATRLHDHFRQRVDALGRSARTWLVVAAAEPSGDSAVIQAAAASLGIDVSGADDAEAAGVVTIRRTVRFRHPLVRSAVYGSAGLDERRAVHRALAATPLIGADRTRRAWHLAAASTGVDDDLADELGRCADEAGSRGGDVSCAALLTRAAELTSSSTVRARRLLGAAERAFAGGSLVQTRALLDRCERRDLDGDAAGRALTLRAWVDVRAGMPRAEQHAVARCLEAALRFGERTPAGRAALLGAAEHAVLVAQLDGVAGIRTVAAAVERSGEPDDADAVVDGFLAAFVAIVRGHHRAAVEHVRGATDALDERGGAGDTHRDHTVLATSLCSAVWDWERRDRVLERAAQTARRDGALSELEMILYAQSMADSDLGDLARAEQRLQEGDQLRATIGGLAAEVTTLYRHPVLVAWTGTDPDLPATAELIIGAGESLGSRAMSALALGAVALDHLARGRYDEACIAGQRALQGDPVGVNTWVAPIVVESAVRSGRDDLARRVMVELSLRAEAAASNVSLGVLARALALVDHSAEAEHAYRRSISLLTPTPGRSDLARSHLVYGEWLRRRKRRSDARTHLRVAHTMFVEMGAAPFAERARAELAATGERIRQRTAATVRVLTPQEDHIARLAAEGMTNAEIGSRLYISAKTVDYHLGKIYRKLGIDSRRDLRRLSWVR